MYPLLLVFSQVDIMILTSKHYMARKKKGKRIVKVPLKHNLLHMGVRFIVLVRGRYKADKGKQKKPNTHLCLSFKVSLQRANIEAAPSALLEEKEKGKGEEKKGGAPPPSLLAVPLLI